MPSALLEITPGVQVGANHITTSGAAVVEEIEPLPRGGVPVPVLGRVPRKLHPLLEECGWLRRVCGISGPFNHHHLKLRISKNNSSVIVLMDMSK